MASILDAPKHWIEKFKLKQKNFSRTRGADACWLWNETVNREGYGIFRWFHPVTKKQFSQPAHRSSLELKLGRKLEEGEQGRHVCPGKVSPDRRCFNPEHLVPGTQSDNEADKTRARAAD